MIKSVTETYIFYSDGTREPVNRERLAAVLKTAAENVTYYTRLHADASRLFDEQIKQLDAIGYDADARPRDIVEEIEQEQRREQYKEMHGGLIAYHNIITIASRNMDKWGQIHKTVEKRLKTI